MPTPLLCPAGHPCINEETFPSFYTAFFCPECDQLYILFPVTDDYLQTLKKVLGEIVTKSK